MSTILFIIFGFGSLILAFFLDGGHIQGIFSLTAAVIVFGGTFSAVGISFPFEDIKRIPRIFGVAFKTKKTDLVELIRLFKELSYKTRKNGLLTIESELATMEVDDFIKKGLQLVVDGVEPQNIQSILVLDAESASARHKRGYAMLDAAGGYSPTMGICGTVMGMVHILGNLSNTEALGRSIGTAFLATFYGIATANLLWLNLASKLKVLDKEENNEKALIIEAILLIQVGINPNTLAEKLKGFLNKQEIERFEELIREESNEKGRAA